MIQLLEERKGRPILKCPTVSWRVHGDPARLQHDVANVFSNVRKYSEPGMCICLSAVQDRTLPCSRLNRILNEVLPYSADRVGTKAEVDAAKAASFDEHLTKRVDCEW